ncbi:hypothetical protein A2858_00105 [Candidatus Daviesbacteria bacterium RIFCSPHIGHO2_01_FULL_36_37]|uniref:Uncharacterized protein n=4 Tax=Candidatus Daviesiibacteriota TaxID=1752718 RepID=A0A0G0H963_9BACT|nr:MAG: hypothetical protein US19_C0021G0015 [Candidatus Daviesbacteria bacterium GW2011_GWB1_36_5]KKQ16337.1 MAG: hypothetical protein US28_C0002G0004 [Candidatus Daviesbacteria bacterium GW2011_GWA1_36_8]OGE17386.1 MAG: hypothetical protein A2858_00105 [Candidatus Daviesbacteria bacterium RIFCSPHIGHO2_01_FULL_36_37]OGE33144.1 MAG: hypothetical protein A3C99_03915 [Candidatus Daviesbacteria bacterium RIFCSPHIGHO2_02_FULL_37_9]OGE36743.1 MAG: hypothetical protein A3E66_02315 [Candidatus Daviesb
MIKFVKSKYILLTILIFFLLAISVPAVIFTKGYYEGFLLSNKESSKVKVETVDSKVKINFEVLGEDRANFEKFSQNLGVSSGYLDGIELELDNESIGKVSEITPIEANLEVSDRALKFSSKSAKSLKSALSKSDYRLASGSGVFEMNVNSGSDFKINIKEPKEVLEYATSSGELTLSSKINPWFQTLQRVDRIYIEVKGKALNGEIVLN